MSIQIKCVYGSTKGKVRKNNQDNMSVDGINLPEVHDDLEKMISIYNIDRSRSFCVFDGMGGEMNGEIASYLASSVLSKDRVLEEEHDITDVIYQMNREICACTQLKKNEIMGTTIAGITFTGNRFFAYNVGDSRIYSYDGTLKQLSKDHCVIVRNRKYGLSQYLGIPEEEFLLSPQMVMDKVRTGQQFLICSDGVTDMVSDIEISEVLSSFATLEEKYDRLLQKVKVYGERDNASLILINVL